MQTLSLAKFTPTKSEYVITEHSEVTTGHLEGETYLEQWLVHSGDSVWVHSLPS